VATRVDLSHFSLAQLKQLTPKTVQKIMWGLMRQLMANVVLKFPGCC